MGKGDRQYLVNMGITTLATVAAGYGATALSMTMTDSTDAHSYVSTATQAGLTFFCLLRPGTWPKQGILLGKREIPMEEIRLQFPEIRQDACDTLRAVCTGKA